MKDCKLDGPLCMYIYIDGYVAHYEYMIRCKNRFMYLYVHNVLVAKFEAKYIYTK